MNLFLMGAIMMGFAVAGLFFLRFWRRTGDRLFLIFALAFWLLGLNRLALVLIAGAESQEPDAIFYVIRLVGYVLIIVAILDKNLRHQTGPGSAAAGSSDRA